MYRVPGAELGAEPHPRNPRRSLAQGCCPRTWPGCHWTSDPGPCSLLLPTLAGAFITTEGYPVAEFANTGFTPQKALLFEVQLAHFPEGSIAPGIPLPACMFHTTAAVHFPPLCPECGGRLQGQGVTQGTGRCQRHPSHEGSMVLVQRGWLGLSYCPCNSCGWFGRVCPNEHT